VHDEALPVSARSLQRQQAAWQRAQCVRQAQRLGGVQRRALLQDEEDLLGGLVRVAGLAAHKLQRLLEQPAGVARPLRARLLLAHASLAIVQRQEGDLGHRKHHFVMYLGFC
jgi:hypothetical protein